MNEVDELTLKVKESIGIMDMMKQGHFEMEKVTLKLKETEEHLHDTLGRITNFEEYMQKDIIQEMQKLKGNIDDFRKVSAGASIGYVETNQTLQKMAHGLHEMETKRERDATKYETELKQLVALKGDVAELVRKDDLDLAVRNAMQKLQREAVGKIGSGKDADVPAST